MAIWSYILLIVLGFLPSLIWLGYWLRKDSHPEPKVLIAKTLLLGIMLSPLAIVLELLFAQYAARMLGIDSRVFSDSPWFYLWAAFVEEVVKYLAVYFIVLRSPDFDEPVDAMVYMLTAAMGFAAMENILVINRVFADGAAATIGLWGLRFAGATQTDSSVTVSLESGETIEADILLVAVGGLAKGAKVFVEGREVVLWSGTDPTPVGSEKGVSKIALKPSALRFRTKRLKLYIDSRAVPGWNEIVRRLNRKPWFTPALL